MKEVIERLVKIENGFKPIEYEAKKIVVSKSISDSMKLAVELLENDFYQVRSLAVFLLGYISSKDPVALQILRTKVSNDKSWQVQEILAKSFDQYCMDTGYEKSLPVIKDWLSDKIPNVCRAVTEGLRIWTGRPFFKTNPQVAIQLISQHKAHESEYLRRSVGNSLRDISKKHKVLVDNEILTWDLSNKLILFTYKFVTKSK
ncbi:DNA alkylation repair protein [Algoriphagus sp. Y33]|uniref:DNA alkylation repair protein n=1 Tax=Algoriphagus sp. Y33 TaxID=2772483 RepID=UPI00178152E1|nr:DNA alkylation repair protein [Algoriphagus sp. Y33]